MKSATIKPGSKQVWGNREVVEVELINDDDSASSVVFLNSGAQQLAERYVKFLNISPAPAPYAPIEDKPIAS